MMNIVFSMLLYYLSLFRYIIILLNKGIIILFRSTKLFYLVNAKMVGAWNVFQYLLMTCLQKSFLSCESLISLLHYTRCRPLGDVILSAKLVCP